MSIKIPLVNPRDGAKSNITVADPVVAQQATFNVGETNILSSVDSGNGNLILAQPIVLAQTATLQSLSFYVGTPNGQLRLGLYNDAPGKPATKLAETASFTTIAGWNTKVPLTTPTLPAANYWLAYLPASNSLTFRTGGGLTSFFKAFTFGTMPTTFPASPSSVAGHWSIYATFGGGGIIHQNFNLKLTPGGYSIQGRANKLAAHGVTK